MKKFILLLLALLFYHLSAHDLKNSVINNREWNIINNNETVSGTFFMYKNGNVFIETPNNSIVNYPLSGFSIKDQDYIKKRNAEIISLNKKNSPILKKEIQINYYLYLQIVSICLILVALFILLFKKINFNKLKFALPFLVLSIILGFYSFKQKSIYSILVSTNPLYIDSAFVPFKPKVHTFWNSNYFYIESKGIPDHTMMVGISNHGWQQQVPVPQCYIGSNAWPIPLNAVVASTPIPVNQLHFYRGAIAVAVNGVPIFNPYTNTGVDAFLDGQLDGFGGHCGKADDYHYHTAPLHLYSQTSATLPVAFALDGFAIYGSLEPDGSAMLTLDANHGHYRNGIYHYHGTSSAPYMIGNMVGQVTEDNTHQIIPQASSFPVRTENWGPLNGALITSCTANANNNGYNVAYTLNNISGYATNFSYNTAGVYTYTYVTPTATTINNYNGFIPCQLLNAIIENRSEKNNVLIYPNPARGNLFLKFDADVSENDIQNVCIYNLTGKLILRWENNFSTIDITNLTQGNYIVKIKLAKQILIKKLIVQ